MPPIPSELANQSSSSTSLAISGVTACLVVLIVLPYIYSLFWTWRYAQQHPRPLNKTSGLRLQRYAPVVYAFVVVSSLIEVALSSWLLLQYRFNHHSPNAEGRAGIRLLLFSACWTTLTSGAYTILFLHPIWSTHPVSSIGAQAVWVFLTWLLWVAGAATLDAALPALLVTGSCSGIRYCSQIQTLFAFSVLEILVLTAGMAILIWLAWRSTREILRPPVQAQ